MKILFHPFEAGVLHAPRADQRVLVLDAEAGFALPPDFAAGLSLVQGFKPQFDALAKAGYEVSPEPRGSGYDMVLLLCGRHRGRNELYLAEALERGRAGALIVVAGGKEDGIASLRKRVVAMAVVEGSLSKYHGIAFWMRRPASADEAIGTLRRENGPVRIAGGFIAAPGMFSHDRIDPGSQLLADCLAPDLKGRAGDFCAGWGFLSVALAQRAPGIGSVDLYEADHASLQAARTNVAALAPAIAARFFWHDLVGEPVTERYDLIVMNPPFHTGRAAEPRLGEALIRAAARALGPAGQLFLVANRQLPYEATLAAAFRQVEKLREEAGFKVFRARR